MKKKEKLLFVNIPDASNSEMKEIFDSIKHIVDQIDFPYRLIVIGGKKWESIDKEELVKALTSQP